VVDTVVVVVVDVPVQVTVPELAVLYDFTVTTFPRTLKDSAVVREVWVHPLSW
jgi:hypothetical protein